MRLAGAVTGEVVSRMTDVALQMVQVRQHLDKAVPSEEEIQELAALLLSFLGGGKLEELLPQLMAHSIYPPEANGGPECGAAVPPIVRTKAELVHRIIRKRIEHPAEADVSPGTATLLMGLLDAPDGTVRQTAAISLRRIALRAGAGPLNSEIVHALHERIFKRQDRNPQIPISLGFIHGPAAFDLLYPALLREPHGPYRGFVFEGLMVAFAGEGAETQGDQVTAGMLARRSIALIDAMELRGVTHGAALQKIVDAFEDLFGMEDEASWRKSVARNIQMAAMTVTRGKVLLAAAVKELREALLVYVGEA